MAVQYTDPVWEWMDDYNHWAEFDPSCAVDLENGFTSGSSTIRLSLSPYDPPSYDVYFISRDGSQRNKTNNGPEESLTRTHTPPTAPIWSYTTSTRAQHSHPPAISALIETNYTEAQSSKAQNRALGLGAFNLSINGEQYFISFATEGYQVNRSSRRPRGIRRRAGPHVGGNPVGGPAASLGYDPQLCFLKVKKKVKKVEVDCAVCFEAIKFETESEEEEEEEEEEVEEEEEEKVEEEKEEEEVVVEEKEEEGGEEGKPADPPLTPASFISSLAIAAMSVIGASASSTATSSSTTSAASVVQDMQCVQLSKCIHMYHLGCIQKWFDKRPACPECLTSYGEYRGTQPTEGASMTVTVNKWRSDYGLQGLPHVDVIEIVYHFDSSVQGREHPKPGKPYGGTIRIAYLPDNEEGKEVLALLRKAWERRLVFTVGQSVTTGRDDCVIWNGIHHKTSMDGGAAQYGYPDESYFVRVKGELADLGVRRT